MEHTRSNSVPLLNLDDDDEIIDEVPVRKLNRSSFSMSSIHHIITRPSSPRLSIIWNDSMNKLHDTDDDDSYEYDDYVDYGLDDTNDDYSTASGSSEDEISIAIPGRKTMAVSQMQQQHNIPAIDLSSNVLYEDIWIDSPIFHEYLQSLENWLYYYLTWLEKVEQCRQLEIAYNKSMAQLYDQTKLMLNEPFFTPDECSNLNWPSDKKSVIDEEIWDNEDIRSILPHLRDHGSKIKEILTRYEASVIACRVKHLQLSNNYCAAQKLKTQTNNNKSVDELASSLYASKRDLCKTSLEYLSTLSSLIKSTRSIVHEKICPLFKSLKSDKHRNLKSLEELVLTCTDFFDDINSKKSASFTSYSSSSNFSNMSEDRTPSPTLNPVSFESYDELNNERLSYYIQDKLAAYHSSLKISQPHENPARVRPSSPTSLIPFSFLNKPKLVQRLNSLDSLLSTNVHSLVPPGSQMTAKGYLLLKKRPHGISSNYTNGLGAGHHANGGGGRWERYYFYITKDDGHLKQYKDQAATVVLTDLKNASVNASETDKRDFVIQVSSPGTNSILSLQAETPVDFSIWLRALRSWNPNQIKINTGLKKSPQPSTSAKLSTARKNLSPKTQSPTNRSFLSKKASFAITTTSKPDQPFKKNNTMDILSPTNLRLSPTSCVSSSDGFYNEQSCGYPIPVISCPVNCYNSTQSMNHPKAELSGHFRVYKSCISKLSCTSHHTGALHLLYVSLFENGILHLQTEKGDNTFFHRPINLTTLAPQDVYAFSDSIDHMKYCVVVRPLPSETYHLITCNKVERDIWLARLKRICNTNAPIPSTGPTSRTVFSLAIKISEARRFQVNHKDSIHSEMYCDILMDNEIRGLTGSLKKTSQLFWREEFVFPDISRIRSGITINIYSRNSKKDRETTYGSVFLPVSQIESGFTKQEEWYEVRKESKNRAFASLTSLGSSNGSLGQLRVGVAMEEHKVFSLEVYQPLMDVLTDFRHEMIYEIARKTTDVQGFARNLLRIYEGMGLTLTWIKSLIDFEVASLSSDDVNILFRGNSFFTKVIESYMKMSGKEFLEEALQFTIQKICKFSLHIEVETSRLSNSTAENTMTNCIELFSHVRSIWGGIQKAKTKCPIELRRVFGYLQSAIVRKFDLGKEAVDRHHEVARYTCVSGFVFLRWICPAIISPKQFGLVQDHPDTKTGRTLTLIAKCLMTLASHSSIEQNAKEPWTVRLNEFVQNNTHHFMNFINFVSLDEKLKDNDSILLMRQRQEEIIAPYFIDLTLELSQLTTWCSQECNIINSITRTCKSIAVLQKTAKTSPTDIVIQQANRRKARPQPWQYGEDISLTE